VRLTTEEIAGYWAVMEGDSESLATTVTDTGGIWSTATQQMGVDFGDLSSQLGEDASQISDRLTEVGGDVEETGMTAEQTERIWGAATSLMGDHIGELASRLSGEGASITGTLDNIKKAVENIPSEKHVKIVLEKVGSSDFDLRSPTFVLQGAIESLVKYADDHPVNVTMGLFGTDGRPIGDGGLGINLPGFRGAIDQIVSEMSDELSARLSVGGAIGSLGGMAARMLEEQALDPLEKLMDSLDKQIEQARLESETAMGATARMAALEELTRLEQERAEASQEYAEQQERILELQKKQEQFAFLQQQIRLLDMIAEHGLDTEQILGGMELGVDASLESIVDAMTAALAAIIEQTEADLGISSPSRVFARFGREMMAGLAMGIGQFSSLPMQAIEPSIVPSLPSVAGMAGGQTFSNTTRGGDFNVENMNVNNGMDAAELRWFILETVREGI
jgi:hypothetical protein